MVSDMQTIHSDLGKVRLNKSHIAPILVDHEGAFMVRIVRLDDSDAREMKISSALRQEFGTDLLQAYWAAAGESLPPYNETKRAAALLTVTPDVKAHADEEVFYAYGNLAPALDALVQVGVLSEAAAVPFVAHLMSNEKLAHRPGLAPAAGVLPSIAGPNG